MKPAVNVTPSANAANAGTMPDDIPPVHVLEAAQNQDRKETEDLLAGFDRPGRGPKLPSPERDFVDYYAKKKGGGPDSGSGPSSPSSRPSAAQEATVPRVRQKDVATVVVRRKGDGAPAWLVWGAAAALMLVIGGSVAYLATSETTPSTQAPGPSAATTITAATPIPQSSIDNIPPPDPTQATVVTEVSPSPSPVSTADAPSRPSGSGSASGSGRRDPRAPSSGAAVQVAPRDTSTADDSKPPPRDDFIRDL